MVDCGCRQQVAAMGPLPTRYDNMSLSSVPLTLAGQALEDAKAVELPTTDWDKQPVQLLKKLK